MQHTISNPQRDIGAFYKAQIYLWPMIMMHTNTRFGTYLFSAGTQHGILHQLSGTTSSVTYYSLRAHRNRCYPQVTEEDPHQMTGKSKSHRC